MKEEALRMDRVTLMDQGALALNHFCLNVFAGEIMGLVPVNGAGMEALLRLLKQNLPIHYGYVYVRERLVNDWKRSNGGYNRVSVIEGRSGLADDLTVADNVFVLRHGFGKRVISRGVLRRQLMPIMRAIGTAISADAYAKDLTTFERFAVEIVKAVVAGDRLIVLRDAGTVVSDSELKKLHDVLRYFAGEGVAFLYISQHYEEIRQICGRAALMMNGQIAKVLGTGALEPVGIQCFGVEKYEALVLQQEGKRQREPGAAPALEILGLRYGAVRGLDLSIAPGECVVVQDMDNHMIDDFMDVVGGQRRPRSGSVRVNGQPLVRANRRSVAVIEKLATRTMLFPELSYLDNLCFLLDHRLPGIWRRAKTKQSVRAELSVWLGADVFDKHIDALTQLQKYDLIYGRILLQRPSVAFCVQPFMQGDVEQRMHIWKLLEMLLEKGIAVVILAVNLADTLSLADRLVRVADGCVQTVYTRAEFSALPANTPWHYLWDAPK